MTCPRCAFVYLWGACPRCLGYRHVWSGSTVYPQRCLICGITRETFRKYLSGNKGSTFKRSYEGTIGKAPKCL